MSVTIKEYEIVNLFNEFKVDFEVRNIQQEVSELVGISPDTAIEMTRWLDERKIELATIDSESQLDVYTEFQKHVVDLFYNKEINYDNACEVRSWAKQQWLKHGEELDNSFNNVFDSINYDEDYNIFNDTRSEAKILNYLTHFASKLSCKGLHRAKFRLFELRKKPAKNQKPMSYDIYIKCMLLVLGELVTKYPNNKDQKLFDKFTEMQLQLEMISGEGRTDIADMNINMEDVIDLKRAAEKISAKNFNRISVEEAFLMLVSQREGNFDDTTWNLEIADF
jgi:hypothetical protein